MIIDVHNHITVKEHPFHLPQEEYLNAMDECGVDKMVILGKDYGKIGDRKNSNLPDEEVVSFVKAHPDRFIGFTAVHPDRDIKKNVERVERAVSDLGLKGIKLNPASGF
ncbi:MAG TPA: amidohydrolase family protein, partial [Thermodesulfobacteriota bacterium]|nr:amidohydrolase family protein [Thermodesulfobacteriota bacterium]